MGNPRLEEITMATGTVKWFNPAKGYGFIEPEDGSKDVFVHISAVERAGLSSLSEAQKVSYELQPGQGGKSSAENLSVIELPRKAPPPIPVGGGPPVQHGSNAVKPRGNPGLTSGRVFCCCGVCRSPRIVRSISR